MQRPGDCGKMQKNGQQPVSSTRARVSHLLSCSGAKGANEESSCFDGTKKLTKASTTNKVKQFTKPIYMC
jgi:hypothetical protein